MRARKDSTLFKLQKLKIENYKAFDEALFKPEEGLTVLLGTNGAGKTSLMEAMSLLAEIARGSDTSQLFRSFKDRSRYGFGGCLPWQDISRQMRFEIEAKQNDSAYQY